VEQAKDLTKELTALVLPKDERALFNWDPLGHLKEEVADE
jgi:hypothetical protein